MKTKAICAAAFALALVFGSAQSIRAQTAKFAVRKSIPLTQTVNGTMGRLEFVTDARVKSGMSDAETTDFAPARLRAVTPNGAVAWEKKLERSRAELETAPPLYGTKTARPTYLLTVDYSADMGSYNGPITFLVEVVDGKPRYASVQNKPITLMRSLKTDWKFWPEKSKPGRATDILEVACRPNSAAKLSDENMDNDFVVIYRRFHFNGRGWTKREKSRVGFWEDDGKFPPVSLFPAPVL